MSLSAALYMFVRYCSPFLPMFLKWFMLSGPVELLFLPTVRYILALWCGPQNYITAFTQVCRKSQLKGGLECKLMLLFCAGIVHTNLYN